MRTARPGEAWRALATAVGNNPRIVGYDLMNEPYQGFIPPGVFATQYLYPAQSRWISTIREVDADAIGFFEPPNAKNVHLPTMPPTDVPDGTVYAPHLYGLWDASDDLTETRQLAQLNFEYSDTESRQRLGKPSGFEVAGQLPGDLGSHRCGGVVAPGSRSTAPRQRPRAS